MELEKRIIDEFSLEEVGFLEESYIKENTDLLWVKGNFDPMKYVPNYILWCLRNRDRDGNLVAHHIIRTLSEYGRAKNPNNDYLNFKYKCSLSQKELVIEFLKWSRSGLVLAEEEIINRAIKQWQK